MTSDVQISPSHRDFSLSFYRWLLPVAALLIAAVMAFAIFQPVRVLPRIGLAPGYSFRDQAGNPFTSESVRGALTLYTFAAIGCTEPCVSTPATLASMQKELDTVEMGEIPLQFVTIYVDPEAATPATLQAQAQRLAVDPDRWHFVTGDPAQLKQVIGAGFETYYDQNEDGSYTVAPVYVLVDGWGIVRAVYRLPSPDVAMLKRDLGLVAGEAIHSTGVNRYAYEAAHLFMCYPK